MRHSPEVESDELQARLDCVQRERDRLSGILQSMGDAVICTDETRALSFMNAKAQALTGWSFADAEGLPVTSIFALRDEEGGLPTLDPLQVCLRSGAAQVSEKGYSLKTRDDYLRPIGFSVALIKTAEGNQHGLVIIFNDVADVRAEERRLAHSATHDGLTGLPNRLHFRNLLTQAMEAAALSGGTHVLCLLDLDRFKAVNDRGGHMAGDEVLVAIAKTLRRLSPPQHVVARLGGDEFAVLMTGCDAAKAEWFATRLIREIRNQAVILAGKSYQVGASIGGALIDADVTDQDQILHYADMACYRSKQRGRNGFTMHEPAATSWSSDESLKSAG